MNRQNAKFAALCAGIVILTGAPIWGVQYFVNQDGSGHVQSAWIMLELLRGNSPSVDLYQFNLPTFPNSLGHWIQAGSLLFLSPFASTKLMLSLTYFGVVAGAAWLRWCTHGRDGLAITTLAAAVISFNWVWLVGAYNFNLGLALTLVAIGCYFSWESELTAKRTLVLSVLFTVIFLSHIVAFLMVGAAIGCIALIKRGPLDVRRLLRTAVAFVPVAPMLYLYWAGTEAGGELSPVWLQVTDPYSIAQWIKQIRTADSLFIMRRNTLPFLELRSYLFIAFAPLVWLSIAIIPAVAATYRKSRFREHAPLAALASGVLLVSFFAPDGLQYSTSVGGVIRERIFIFALLLSLMLFRFTDVTSYVQKMGFAVLGVILAIQSLGLWEFALRSDRDAREFFSVSEAIPERAAIVGVTVEPETERFAVMRISSLSNYNSMRPQTVAWDNYEFGHYLFPVMLKDKRYQEFAMAVTGSNVYDPTSPESLAEHRFAALERCLASEDPRVDTLTVWGSHERIDAMAEKYFGEAVFQKGRMRVFRR